MNRHGRDRRRVDDDSGGRGRHHGDWIGGDHTGIVPLALTRRGRAESTLLLFSEIQHVLLLCRDSGAQGAIVEFGLIQVHTARSLRSSRDAEPGDVPS